MSALFNTALAATLFASTLAVAATSTQTQKSAPAQPPQKPAKMVINGFEYVGGETGWQLVQHRFVIDRTGKLVHSEDCDHARRPAPAAPTAQELEVLRQRYPAG